MAIADKRPTKQYKITIGVDTLRKVEAVKTRKRWSRPGLVDAAVDRLILNDPELADLRPLVKSSAPSAA